MGYEVERRGGEVLLRDGHFVHFLAPDTLPVMEQHVVFVIDTSGSMRGRKMEQTKAALSTILRQVHREDYISIIHFDNDVRDLFGGDLIVDASEESIENTIEKVNKIEASGGSNIHDALIFALDVVNQIEENLEPVIIFLTDGEPSEGITGNEAIQKAVRNKNVKNVTICSLAFGQGADYEMLKTLSLQNQGFARRIYDTGDASIQLSGFYKEVSNPLLSKITFSYLDGSVDTASLTETRFHRFYRGKEMVVAGRLDTDTDTGFQYRVTGEGSQVYTQEGEVDEVVDMKTDTPVDSFLEVMEMEGRRQSFLERLWAFLTVRDLLVEIEAGVEEAKPKAISLALHYKFVTPLTSLVVVRPMEDKQVHQEQEQLD